MKCNLSNNTSHAVEMINNVLDKVVDSHHWIGDNSLMMNKRETLTFIKEKLPQQRHLTVRQYEDRVCVELGLSGRNQLNIDLV